MSLALGRIYAGSVECVGRMLIGDQLAYLYSTIQSRNNTKINFTSEFEILSIIKFPHSTIYEFINWKIPI